MSEEKGSVRFDHREIAVIFSLFIFVALLMFTVGILVGKGLTMARYEGQGGVNPHLASLAGHAGAGTGDREPAQHPPSHDSTGTSVSTEDHHENAHAAAPAEHETEHVAEHAAPDEHAPAHEEKVAAAETEQGTHAGESDEPLKLVPANPPPATIHGELKNKETKETAKIFNNPKLKDIFEGGPNNRKVASLPKDLPKSAASGGFTVQVGSYPSQKEAEERVEALKKLGFPNAYASANQLGEGKETWYRVCLGYYPDYKAANTSGAILQSRGEVKSYLVRKTDKAG